VAKKLGVHRRMVREAISSALPSPRKRTERPRWKLKAAVEFVDAILEADRRAPRKQRHTAHRVWARIQSELPDCKIAERTVREYVHTRKIALGLLVREVCVPQSYVWGVEAQIDWYEAYADLAGERLKLQVFAMRSMASGAAFQPCLPACDATGFSGSARTGLPAQLLLCFNLVEVLAHQPQMLGDELPITHECSDEQAASATRSRLFQSSSFQGKICGSFALIHYINLLIIKYVVGLAPY
jgi:hypothetical protein